MSYLFDRPPRHTKIYSLYCPVGIKSLYEVYKLAVVFCQRMVLHTGDKAPAFALKDQNGVLRRLTDAKGKYLILFFYPKDNTPGCTAEACGFRDNFAKFKAYEAKIWGISGDSQESHKQFAEKYSLSFPLLCDTNNVLRNNFKVPKTLGLVPGRVTYVINPQQRICHVFNNLLDGPAHVNEALRFLENETQKQ